MSRAVSAPSAARRSPASTSALPRSAPRGAKRRKPARPPQPRNPEDFFDEKAQTLLKEVLSRRADSWQRDREPPVLFYRRDSEPQWDAYASVRCSGTTLRIAGARVLYHGISIDLERGLRLLTMTWTEKNTTTDGGHSVEEWRVALAGVLWRVGQHYREFTRRWGQARALEILQLTMDGLWHNAPRRLLDFESPALAS
ncbi:MAG TPA: hypothetical protein VKT82_05925 [Ktedonobacterales bacterium]|nr:hypothetical protein [Ktedonobacterales bacterium]